VSGTNKHAISFDAFEVDLTARELRKRGVRLKLQDQPFQVLAALLEKPGEVVTRGELQDRIWGDDTFVDFDKSLSAAVNKVRLALDDSRMRPRFIETVPKVGYRFIHSLDDRDWLGSSGEVQAETGGQMGNRTAARLRWAVVVAGLAGAVLFAWLYLPDFDAPNTAGPLSVVPLTSYEGREDSPTFSPDGSQMAFIWQARDDENTALYVKSVGSEQARRVTDHSAEVNYSAWSPDGSVIAYILRDGESCELRLISPLGGASRMVATITCPLWVLSYSQLAWSPDGRFLVYPHKPRVDAPRALFAIEPVTREIQQLTHPPVGIYGDDGPSFAWEENRLSFIRRVGAYEANEIRIIELDEASAPTQKSRVVPVLRSPPFRFTHSVIWAGDDGDLLFLDLHGLWRVASEGGEATQLLAASGRLKDLAMSRNGHRLALVQFRQDVDIWQFDRRSGQVRPLVVSAYRDSAPSISPKGDRITWRSLRSGFGETWVCNADGSDPLQITSGQNHSGPTVWSPDGKTLAFSSRVNGNGDIYLMDSGGGIPRRLTQDPGDDLQPGWSSDGSAVFFISNRDGGYMVWSQNIDSSEAQRVSDSPATWPKASPGGQLLFFRGGQNDGHHRLHRKRLTDGEESAVLEGVSDFAPTARGIYFALRESGAIRYLDLESGEVEELFAPELPTESIAVSADEQTILYTQREPPQADVMLVEGFE